MKMTNLLSIVLTIHLQELLPNILLLIKLDVRLIGITSIAKAMHKLPLWLLVSIIIVNCIDRVGNRSDCVLHNCHLVAVEMRQTVPFGTSIAGRVSYQSVLCTFKNFYYKEFPFSYFDIYDFKLIPVEI